MPSTCRRCPLASGSGIPPPWPALQAPSRLETQEEAFAAQLAHVSPPPKWMLPAETFGPVQSQTVKHRVSSPDYGWSWRSLL